MTLARELIGGGVDVEAEAIAPELAGRFMPQRVDLADRSAADAAADSLLAAVGGRCDVASGPVAGSRREFA